MYYFTADEHYYHKNIIKFCDRPFIHTKEMNLTMIQKHNNIVKNSDQNITIHAGDFSFGTTGQTKEIINQLNGGHIFLQGSHDRWGNSSGRQFIWQGKIGKEKLTVCHYAMRTWHCSHWNSWQLYGHTHGTLEPVGKQLDIGVDTNNFEPYSFNDIQHIMGRRPDNPNFIKIKDR